MRPLRTGGWGKPAARLPWIRAGTGTGAATRAGCALASAGLINDPNTAASFDGNDDRMYFSDSASLSPTTAISVEAWVRPDAVPTAAGSGWYLVSKWNTALLVLAPAGAGQLKFGFNVYSTGSWVQSTTVVGVGTTYHVVGTYDGANLRIYVNGALQATVARTGAVNDSSFGGALAGGGWEPCPARHSKAASTRSPSTRPPCPPRPCNSTTRRARQRRSQ